jgi:NADH-quinone oxidoreductase subunit B
LIRAVLDIQEKISRTGTIDGREFAARSSYEGPTSLAREIGPEETLIAPGDSRSASRLRIPLN